MAAPFWSSTLAPAENSPTEIRKGLFDLLKKMQEISQYLDGFYLDGVLSVEEVDTQILRAVQIFLNGQDLSAWLNQDVRTTASPTFARVITPRVDNAGGALQLNPAGGNVLVGTGTSGGAGGAFQVSGGTGSNPLMGVWDPAGANFYIQAVGTSDARLGTTSNHPLLFIVNGGERVNISPAGYTKLGADAGAPGVKMKELPGTTASTQGGSVAVSHGITNASKIFPPIVSVNYSGNNWINSAYLYFNSGSGGYIFTVEYNDTDVTVSNSLNDSFNILSKQFKILIFYKE